MPIKHYSWKTLQHDTLPGTEDWEEVATIHENEMYEWEETRVYYSPSARKYFYGTASGCSCNDWEDMHQTVADLRDGDKQDVLNWAKRPAHYRYSNKEARAKFVAKIRDHKPE